MLVEVSSLETEKREILSDSGNTERFPLKRIPKALPPKNGYETYMDISEFRFIQYEMTHLFFQSNALVTDALKFFAIL